jgi:hypothetical protein
MPDPNFVILCAAEHDSGERCVRPKGEPDYRGWPHDQHRGPNGKRWYYSVGERDRAMSQSIPDYLGELARRHK